VPIATRPMMAAIQSPMLFEDCAIGSE